MTRENKARAALLAGVFTLASLMPAAAENFSFNPNVSPSRTVALPIPAGRIKSAVARLPSLTERIMQRTGVPGMAVVVVQDGKVIFMRGFGVRKAGENAPVDADTVFQLASLSKSIGAGVVAHEVGAGVVSWDTPVVKALPWFALNDPWVTTHVTLADLYSHRSGLPDHAGDDLEDMGYDRHAVLERLRLLPLAPFRASYAYTNFGLTAAAEAAAVAAGKDWASLSEEVLYRPLGMSSTSSRFADYMKQENRAIPHVREAEGFVAKYQRQPDAQSPAGGVSSSARDMGRWLAFVLDGGSFEGKQIVPEKDLLPALSPQVVARPPETPDSRASFYGYGFDINVSPSARVMFNHSGAFALGAATTFQLMPSERLGIVVLSNAQPVGAVEAVAANFMDLVQFGTLTRDWLTGYAQLMAPMFKPLGKLVGQKPPADPTPAQPLGTYAGTYSNPYFGDATVSVSAGHLVLSVGPKPVESTLAHWNGDDFTYMPAGENAPEGSISQVKFTREGAGDAAPAKSLWVEFLDENGFGTFTRK